MSVHKQMCKKIAQLTMVVHRLNTFNEDHEAELFEREKLHRNEVSRITEDANSKIGRLCGDLNEKASRIAALTESKDIIMTQKRKDRVEYGRKIKECHRKLHQIEEELSSNFLAETMKMTGRYQDMEERTAQNAMNLKIQTEQMKLQVEEQSAECCSRIKQAQDERVAAIAKMEADHKRELDYLVKQHKMANEETKSLHHREKCNLNKDRMRQIEARKRDFETIERDFKTKLQKHNDRCMALESCNADLVIQIEMKDSIIRDVTTSREDYVLRCRRLGKKLEDEVQRGDSRAHKIMKEHERQLSEWKENEKMLRKKLIDLRNEKVNTETALKATRSSLVALTSELDNCRESIKSLQHQLVGTSKKAEEKDRRRSDEINNLKLAMRGDKIRFDSKMQAIYERMQIFHSRTKSLAEVTRNQRSECVHQFEAVMSDMESCKIMLKKMLDQCSLQKERFQQQWANKLSRAVNIVVLQMESEINKFEERLLNADKRLHEREKELVGNLCEERQGWRNLLQKLTEQGGNIIDECNSRWENRLKELKRRMNHEQQHYKIYIGTLKQSYHESMQKLRVDHDAERSFDRETYQKSCEDLKKKNERLQAVSRQSYEELNAINEDLSSNISHLMKKTKDNDDIVEELHCELGNANRMVDKLRTENERWVNSMDDLEHTNEELRSKVLTLEEEIERLVEARSCLNKTYADLEEERKSAMNTLLAKHKRGQMKLEIHLEARRRNERALWRKNRNDLRTKLHEVQSINGDLGRIGEERQVSIRLLERELEHVKKRHTKSIISVRRHTSNLLAETYTKEDESRYRMRLFYINQIQLRESKLLSTAHDLECTKFRWQCVKISSDKVIMQLREELTKSRARETEFQNELTFYKRELQNREDNFNLRFADAGARGTNVGIVVARRRTRASRKSRIGG